ncbi:hypothetical protein BH10BAC3_BH10BAC3_06410 [soil metagenome]
MNQQVTLRIKLVKPPPSLNFALQQGAGNIYELVQKQISGNEDLIFVCPVKCTGDRQKDILPKLGGSFVQGPAGAKFIYIGSGAFAGNANSVWSRRLKVPLTRISWPMLDEMIANANLILETTVPGTAKDGGPNCATVKPFDGWRITSV